MDEDLDRLGEALVTTAARLVRWAPKDGVTISLSAARIMARLADDGPTRISDLAARERCSQPTITNHVKRLETAGLLVRAADPTDARAWMITLTDDGRETLAGLRSIVGTNVGPYLARLTKRELKAIGEAIEAMQRMMSVDRLPG